ncbi:MAG: hypothetical protein CL748_01440 [Chloroflexi bacterium]|nr:hypothetical protein [Chloroflexota bacterium]
MVRKGKWKLIYEHGKKVELELYNLKEDPNEFNNLSKNPDYKHIIKDLSSKLLNLWGDPDKLRNKIVYDQNSRSMIRKLSGKGKYF